MGRLSLADRQKIRDLRAQGRTVSATARLVECAASTVKYYSRSGQRLDDRRPKRGQGRKHLIPQADLKEFAEIVLANTYKNNREKMVRVKAQMGTECCESTFRLALRRAKIAWGKPKKVLKISPANRAKRVAFANAHRNTNWDNVIFSDEKVFRLGVDGVACHYRIGARPETEVTGFGAAVGVWWGICKTRRIPPVIYAGSLDSAAYTRVLDQGLRGRGLADKLFQQDNARCHTAAGTAAYLARRRINVLPDWPAQSPDLNPIENAWAMVDREVKLT